MTKSLAELAAQLARDGDKPTSSILDEVESPGKLAMPTTKQAWREYLLGPVNLCLGDEELNTPDEVQTEEHMSWLEWTWQLWCAASARSADGRWRELTEERISNQSDAGNFDWLLWGNRGGSKTLGLAIVLWSLCYFHTGYSGTHAAASKDQAAVVIGYMHRFAGVENPISPFKDEVRTGKYKPTNRKIQFINGNFIQLTTGSTKEGLNAVHTIWFSYDEVELVELELIAESRGIAKKKSGFRFPAMNVYCSTQKYAGATMSVLIKDAKKGKYKLAKWNAFEVTETCQDFRTKTLPDGLSCQDFPELRARVDTLELLTSRTVAQKEELRVAGAKVRRLENNCHIVRYCQGKLKHASGYMSIDGLKKDCDLDDPIKLAYFEAQMIGMRPSPVGLVYPTFGEQNISDRAVPVHGCWRIGLVDPGYAPDPLAINILQINGPYLDVVREVHIKEKIRKERALELIYDLDREYGISEMGSLWIVDGSYPEWVDSLYEDYGIEAESSYKGAGSLDAGADLVLLRIHNEGHRSLRVHPDCQETIDEFYLYRRDSKGKIPRNAKNNHHMDCLRYGIYYLDEQNSSESHNIRAGQRLNHSGGR